MDHMDRNGSLIAVIHEFSNVGLILTELEKIVKHTIVYKDAK